MTPPALKEELTLSKMPPERFKNPEEGRSLTPLAPLSPLFHWNGHKEEDKVWLELDAEDRAQIWRILWENSHPLIAETTTLHRFINAQVVKVNVQDEERTGHEHTLLFIAFWGISCAHVKRSGGNELMDKRSDGQWEDHMWPCVTGL